MSGCLCRDKPCLCNTCGHNPDSLWASTSELQEHYCWNCDDCRAFAGEWYKDANGETQHRPYNHMVECSRYKRADRYAELEVRQRRASLKVLMGGNHDKKEIH